MLQTQKNVSKNINGTKLEIGTILIIGVLTFFSLSLGLGAQEKGDIKASSQTKVDADVPDRSIEVSDVFQAEAKKGALKYDRKFQRDVQRLHVLVKNFGGDVTNSVQTFGTIKSSYQEALIRYYKQQYTWSFKLYEENDKRIKELYEKFSEKFKIQVIKLLEEGSKKLVERKLTQTFSRGQSGKKVEIARGYQKNLTSADRLKYAYYQNGLASDMDQKKYHNKAIQHYRLAKIFAIRALWSMEDDSSRQIEVEKKYNKDLLDSRGLLVE